MEQSTNFMVMTTFPSMTGDHIFSGSASMGGWSILHFYHAFARYDHLQMAPCNAVGRVGISPFNISGLISYMGISWDFMGFP